MTDIPVHYAQKFSDDVRHLAQQMESKLSGTVRDDGFLTGHNEGFFEYIGPVEPVERLATDADTPNLSADHYRRRIKLRTFDWAKLLDSYHVERMLNDHKMPYQEAAMAAMMRKRDALILAASRGTAYSVAADKTETAVALPTAQKIAHNSEHLTLAKLEEAAEILDTAEAPEEGRVLVVNPRANRQLMQLSEVKSIEFSDKKNLMSFRVGNKLASFDVVVSNRITTAAGIDYIMAYHRNGIGMMRGQETVQMTQRADKNYAWQVFLSYTMDATRVEDALVVEIACER
jgi:hypothetical protein